MTESEPSSDTILSEIRNIEPNSFERFVSDIWTYLGYDTKVTSSSRDKGIDIVASRDFPYDEKILIQAKRYSADSTLSGPEMQKYGRLTGKDGVDLVIVVSTGGFTSQALEIAEEENIKCVGGRTLAHLVASEDIYELLQSYVEEGAIQTPEPKRSPSGPKVENERHNIVGEGDCLEIEIVGFDNVYLDYEDRDEDIYEERKYTVVCMHVKNKTEYEWHFFGYNHLGMTSADGFSYDNHQGNSWSSRSGQLTPWNNAKNHDIKPNSRSRVVAMYKGWFDPERIEYTTKLLHAHGDDDRKDGKERITIHMDESAREELRSLPDSFPKEDICLN